MLILHNIPLPAASKGYCFNETYQRYQIIKLFQTNHTENSHCFSVLNEDKIKEKILSQMLKAQCHIKIHLLVKHLN